MITANNEDDGYTPKSQAVGVGSGACSASQEQRYNWEIEIVAEREEESGLRVRFQGTHTEASRKADKLADGAPYEVRACVLHRCGLVSPNK